MSPVTRIHLNSALNWIGFLIFIAAVLLMTRSVAG